MQLDDFVADGLMANAVNETVLSVLDPRTFCNGQVPSATWLVRHTQWQCACSPPAKVIQFEGDFNLFVLVAFLLLFTWMDAWRSALLLKHTPV